MTREHPTHSRVPADKWVKTTLIIASRNRPSMLEEAIAWVLESDTVPDEIVVLDQSSRCNERLASLEVPDCAFTYVHSLGVGVSLGRNTGVARASHPIVAFIDDDVRVSPTWFGTITARVREGDETIVVAGRVIAGRPEVAGGFAPALSAGQSGRVYRGTIARDVLISSNMAMYRQTYIRVGGFDENLGPGSKYGGAEDNDFGYRLLRSGHAIIYEPTAVVFHRAWRDPKHLRKLSFAYGRGQGAFFAKYPFSPHILRRLFRTFVHVWIRALRQMRVHPARSVADLVYLGGYVSGYVEHLILDPLARLWQRAGRE